MPTLAFQNETYTCAKAQKGNDFIKLLDEGGNVVFFADGVSDFSPYTLENGEWEPPVAGMAPTVGAAASVSEGIVTLEIPPAVKIESNLQVNFIAPCSCLETVALRIGGENYTVVDALCNCVTGMGGKWAAGAIVSVILDIEKKFAYVQNDPISSVVHGSYVGTGIPSGTASNPPHGRDHPTRLELGFEPRMVWIVRGEISAFPSMYSEDTYNEKYACFMNPIPGIWIYDPIYKTSMTMPVTWDSTGIEFYYPGELSGMGAGGVPAAVYNESGVTYHYIAIR